MAKKQKTRSPLREMPLHYPGQSVQEEMDKLYDIALNYAIYIIGVLLLVFVAWEQRLMKVSIEPVFTTLIALLIIGYCIYKIAHIRRKYLLLAMGRDGEKIVGQELELLREKGYAVFHDIKGENFNIDHVIIAPQGLFVVETKTYSKPLESNAKVVYDGRKVLVNGYEPDRDPIKQVTANANWLRDVIKNSTGLNIPVRGAIVFPGWYVDSTSAKGSPVWVLNPKGLGTFIGNEPVRLKDTEAHMIAYHLSKYIRLPS
ncbi:MAG: nuclease-related domain-containing protein [Chloroflexota bacterium]